MIRSLRRLLICGSLILAGGMLLAGPGLHLLSPCDHGHADHDPGHDRSIDGSEDCPVCSLVAQQASASPATTIALDAARPDRAVHLALPTSLDEPGRTLLPRAPPRS